MELINKSLPGVVLIKPDVFEDSRGFFMETYHLEKYREKGLDKVFVQDNHSFSRKGTLRGLHYQLHHAQEKLVYVVAGKIFDVAVDIRRGSPTFGRWTGTLLSAENRHQLFIPEGFAHGFCVLSETAGIIYKCTKPYAPGDEYGILFSDPTIDIVWPIETPILSEKDLKNPALSEISEAFLPKYKELP